MSDPNHADEADGADAVAAPPRRTSIQAIDRSVALLEDLATAGRLGRGLGEIAGRVGLPASTARTLLSSLVAHGLAAQSGHSRRYLLGPRFFELNRTYVAQSDLSALSAPVLRDLWERTRETVHLAVLQGSRRVDLSVLVSPQLLNVNPTGNPAANDMAMGGYQTAAGKVLLADMSERERAHLFSRAGEETLDHGAGTFAAEMERVRQQGYATNFEEAVDGVCGVAAPVFDLSDRTVAALCIGYPSVRHTPGEDRRLRDAVCAAAARISGLLRAEPETGE